MGHRVPSDRSGTDRRGPTGEVTTGKVTTGGTQTAAAKSGDIRGMGSDQGRFFRAYRVFPCPYRLRFAGVAAAAVAVTTLAGCSMGIDLDRLGIVDPRYGVSTGARVVEPGEPIPKGGGTYRVGQAYTVAGKTYVPAEDREYRAEGLASWYGEDFHGRQTANGEVFDMNSLSAAHATLPMPSYVRVTNLENKRSVIVRVNDRGPYHSDRIIDVSVKTAQMLGFYGAGMARVAVEWVSKAPLEGSDDAMLIATLRQGQPAPPPSLVRVAAAKPFLPHGVPVPAERPWGLGQDPGQEPAAGSGGGGYGDLPSAEPPPAWLYR